MTDFLRHRADEPRETVALPEERRRLSVSFLQSVVALTFGRTPLIVPFDEGNPSPRSRRHEQITAGILNSLIWSMQLVETDEQEWSLGFNPARPLDWADTPPTTVKQALDRLVQKVRELTNASV